MTHPAFRREPRETLLERTLKEARERGDFDNLPGAGKPLSNLDEPYDELWWARETIEREKLSVLPETLRLRKEVEDALRRVDRCWNEEAVLREVGEINARIRKVNSSPNFDGPPSTVAPLNPERVLARWRAKHAILALGDEPRATEATAPRKWRPRRADYVLFALGGFTAVCVAAGLATLS